MVTVKADTQPVAPWVKVGQYDRRESAQKAASDYCVQQPQQPTDYPPQPIPPQQIIASGTCDVSAYTTGAIVGSVFSGVNTERILAVAEIATNELSKKIAKGLADVPVVGPIAGVLFGAFSSPIMQAQILAPIAAKLAHCESPSAAAAIETQALLGVLQNTIGVNTAELMPQYSYAANAACRNRQLDIDKATAAFLANSIDYVTLDAYFAIGGYCPDATAKYKAAVESKPMPLQLAMLRRRGLLTPEQYHAGMRRLGYLERDDNDHLFKITEQVPVYSDIIRMMIRDANDETNIDWGESDKLFTQKYGEQLREWAEWQGIPEQAAKFIWRAHWEIPSPTQLFEFWRRLRHKEKFGGKEKLWDDIKKALVQQDIYPPWHDHYQAVATLPLTRVDVRRAYEIGSLNIDAVESAYVDAGYSDENAAILRKFTERLKIEQSANARPISLWLRFAVDGVEAKRLMVERGFDDSQANQAMRWAESKFISSPIVAAFVGGRLKETEVKEKLVNHGVTSGGVDKIIQLARLRITSHPAFDAYAAGTIDADDVRTQASEYGVPATTVDKAIGVIDSRHKADTVRLCVRGLRRRFLTGEIDDKKLEQELQNIGVVPARAKQIVDGLQCSQSAFGKSVPANTLCVWLERGVIKPTEFIDRLKRIGFAENDATEMLVDCLSKVGEKRAREAEKQARLDAAAIAKRKSDVDKATAKANRLASQLERATKQGKATRERRRKQLISAAEKLVASLSVLHRRRNQSCRVAQRAWPGCIRPIGRRNIAGVVESGRFVGWRFADGIYAGVRCVC